MEPTRSPSRVLPPIGEAIKNIKQSMKSFQPTPQRKGLSGIKDVDLKILTELNDRDLFSFCLADKHVNQMCKDEHFWRNRFVSRFSSTDKPVDISWRKYYLTVISELDKYVDNPWKFFNGFSWKIGESPDELVYNMTKTRKSKHIIPFKFLELGKEVTLFFPRDRYGDINMMKKVYKKTYKKERDFSPEEILNIIYNFYQEPITEEEYEEMIEEDVEGIDDFYIEDIQDKKVRHIDLMFGLQFFEGFEDYEGGHLLKLGS